MTDAEFCEWTEEKNRRRCELIDKHIFGGCLAPGRRTGSMCLLEMLASRRKIAPLPLDELRKILRRLNDDRR